MNLEIDGWICVDKYTDWCKMFHSIGNATVLGTKENEANAPVVIAPEIINAPKHGK